MWGTSSSPMSPAAIFLLPLPPGTPNRAPRRCMAAARTEPSRAELGLPAAAAGCAGDRSRAGAGGESGPRGGSGHRDPGASRRGWGDAAIFNPMANRRPSCSVRRGEGSASRSVPGRGRWRGALGQAGSAARGGGLARGRGLPSPGRGREAARPCRRPAGGAPPRALGCEEQLRGSNTKSRNRGLKPACF